MLYQTKPRRINIVNLSFDQSAYFQTFNKFMKKSYIINFVITSMIFYFQVNVDFVKDIICDRVTYLLSKNQWIQIVRVELL